MKVLFHLNSDDVGKQSELLGNIANLVEEKSDATVSVIVNSDGVEIAREGSSAAQYVEEMEEVNFFACSNSLENRDIDEEELTDNFDTVPAAVVKIAELQEDRFNYIKI